MTVAAGVNVGVEVGDASTAVADGVGVSVLRRGGVWVGESVAGGGRVLVGEAGGGRVAAAERVSVGVTKAVAVAVAVGASACGVVAEGVFCPAKERAAITVRVMASSTPNPTRMRCKLEDGSLLFSFSWGSLDKDIV
jgi:hypothetical protein